MQNLQPISLDESRRLISLEETIKKGIATFVDTAVKLINARLVMTPKQYRKFCLRVTKRTPEQVMPLIEMAKGLMR